MITKPPDCRLGSFPSFLGWGRTILGKPESRAIYHHTLPAGGEIPGPLNSAFMNACAYCAAA